MHITESSFSGKTLNSIFTLYLTSFPLPIIIGVLLISYDILPFVHNRINWLGNPQAAVFALPRLDNAQIYLC